MYVYVCDNTNFSSANTLSIPQTGIQLIALTSVLAYI